MIENNKKNTRMILNPNRKIVNKILDRIFISGGYCPCQPIGENKDTKCPCPNFLNHGFCHCSLFVEER